LAQKLNCPLFTDEGVLRGELSKHFQIRCLSSLGFLTQLERSSVLPKGRTVELMAQMIQKNFRTIPFTSRTLYELFKAILNQTSEKITNQLLLDDPIFGVFLRQFGDTMVDFISLVMIAVEWWVAIILDNEIPNELLPECMKYPSSTLTIWRPLSGVLANVNDEAERLAATLWASFLWKCHRIGQASKAYDSWLAIKECCEHLFQDQYHKQHKIKFTLIPEKIVEIANKDNNLTAHQRLTCFVNLPLEFPQGNEDREILENRFRDLAHKLK
jgi:hypothetical protein